MNFNQSIFIPNFLCEITSHTTIFSNYGSRIDRYQQSQPQSSQQQQQQQQQPQQQQRRHQIYSRRINEVTYYQPIQCVISHYFGYPYSALQFPANDTMQRHGSKSSHQRDHSVANKNETGSGIGNDFSMSTNNQQQKQAISGNKQQHQQPHKGRNHSGSGNSNLSKRQDKNQPHPWLVSSLKGHTDEIRDIDFSSNGKYLASCAEDNIIRSQKTGHRNSTSSDLTASDDINSSSSNEDNLSTTYHPIQSKKSSKRGRNRRQRKNQHNFSMEIDDEGKENQQPAATTATTTGKGALSGSLRKQGKNCISPLASVNNGVKQTSATFLHIDNLTKISRAVAPPLRQHTKLNLQESELVKFLRCYLIDPNLLRIYGYPVESAIYNGSVEIFKCLPRPFVNKPHNNWNSNYGIINKNDGLINPLYDKKWGNKSNDASQTSADSGQGSGSSSPPSLDSDASEAGEEETITTFYNPDGSYQIYTHYNQSLEKKCVRCKRSFLVTNNGEYLTKEECHYHWGKINQVYIGNKGLFNQYSCCNGDASSDGCTRNRLHVWSGISVGMNGPYEDFVRTEYKNIEQDNDNNNNNYNYGRVYALDCEMCFTGLGLELAKVTMVGSDGQLVYEHFVKPKCEVVDYNTRFSGITEKDLFNKSNNVKTLEDVQRDLLQLIDTETILIGHALDNDLRVLKILHKNIIDTSIAFPHVSGFPYRRSLKTLTKFYLNRDIQNGDSGHSSFEDSRACLELMLWRVRKDFRTALEQ